VGQTNKYQAGMHMHMLHSIMCENTHITILINVGHEHGRSEPMHLLRN